jgi:hypothetical protein
MKNIIEHAYLYIPLNPRFIKQQNRIQLTTNSNTIRESTFHTKQQPPH